MRFSVIIPLYNKEHYIVNTIKSVLKQTFQDYEVIVVDDGSQDNSYEESIAFRSERVKIIHQENRGVAVARNTGVENAKGEYIA